jgi:iron(II)-dependent oxidoreductase
MRRSKELVAMAVTAALVGAAGIVGMARAASPAQAGTPVATLAGTGQAGGPSSAPSAATPPPRDDGEPDEAHTPGTGASADNPYDETPPARGVASSGAPARQLVPSEGGMLRLPGGRFVMGSTNPHAPPNERPPRAITLPPFWIDRTEVSVAAYRGCVEAGHCPRPARSSSSCTYDAGDADLPVSCVHWRDADAYCHYAGKRLPTEREWEYSARGAYATPFPWGLLPACSNAITLISEQSAKSCGTRPAHVGTHPGGASTFGVQDMSGNVEEWTGDWYVESLSPGPAPRSGAAHVLRGGGWLSPPSMSRTTSRNWGSALEAGPNVCFRCAKDSEPQ